MRIKIFNSKGQEISSTKLLKKTNQDLKREVETIKKIQSETTLEIEILGKKSGTIDVSISNRIQEMEERISVQRIPYRTSAQESKKIQNAKRS